DPVLDDYDLVLIDCPPSLQLLTINALVAADDVLVIAQPQLWSTDGMSELRRTVSLVRDRFNSDLGYAGVLMSMWQGTTQDRATRRNKRSEERRVGEEWRRGKEGGDKIRNEVR